MSAEIDEKRGSWRSNIGMLRWVAIVLPIVFLASLDALRHAVFSRPLHTVGGFVAVDLIIAAGVVTFAYIIFAVIGRLQRRILDQSRRFSALNDIARAAAVRLRLEELLNASLGHIMSNMRADAGLICLVDQAQGEHSAVSSSGFSQELVRNIQRVKLKDDPVAGEVVRTGRAVVMEKVFDDPRVADVAKREGVRSAVSAPLTFEGEVNGILIVATRKERRFNEADQEFLAGIGGQLGMAIRNAVLFEHTQLQNRELAALLEVGKVATSNLNLDELLTKSLDTVIKVTSTDAAELWLTEGDELVMRCHDGAHREAFLERTRFKLGEGVPGLVAQEREPMVVHDLPSDARFLRERVVKAGFHTFGAVPLLYQDKVVGVLAVAGLSPEAVKGQRELRLLQGIGEWLALAIENALLYQQVRDMAILQERERIAREMHDGMGQLLGYINTQTIAVKKLFSDQQLAAGLEELTKLEEIARDLYADVREAMLGLRTTPRRDGGVVHALGEYLRLYGEMTGIQVEYTVSEEGELSVLPPSTEIQLIRIVQEALSNVRKHARASRVTVELGHRDGGLHVLVADDGRGYDPSKLHSAGWPRFGLQTMRERAEAVGGSLSITTAPGEGTKVEVRVPLPLTQRV